MNPLLHFSFTLTVWFNADSVHWLIFTDFNRFVRFYPHYLKKQNRQELDCKPLTSVIFIVSIQLYSYVFGLSYEYNETKTRKTGDFEIFKMTALNYRREGFRNSTVLPR